jgi:hypothetical protein
MGGGFSANGFVTIFVSESKFMTDQPHESTEALSEPQGTTSQSERKFWLKWVFVVYVYCHLVTLVAMTLADVATAYIDIPWPEWMKPMARHLEWVTHLPMPIGVFVGLSAIIGVWMTLFSPVFFIGLGFAYRRAPDNPEIGRLALAELLIVLCYILALIPAIQ